MKNIFQKGDQKEYQYFVKKEDIAAFNEKAVHQVCSTFTLAREIEWSTRLFVLDMLEEEEEGIGTMLEIKHKSPALVGETLLFNAIFEEISDSGEIICTVNVLCRDRKVAVARTGQKILPKTKLNHIFNKIDVENG